MGQQQLLLIILGVIIVGIAIAVGLSLFSAQSIQAAKDAMINDMNNIAAYAYQYKIRPTSMGGGGGTYTGLKLPTKMATNDNGIYTINAGPQSVTIDGDSKSDPGTEDKITVLVQSDGTLTNWNFASYFQ